MIPTNLRFTIPELLKKRSMEHNSRWFSGTSYSFPNQIRSIAVLPEPIKGQLILFVKTYICLLCIKEKLSGPARVIAPV